MRWSLEGRLAALIGGLLLVVATASAFLQDRTGDVVATVLIIVALALFPLFWLTRRTLRPLRRLLRALSGAVDSYRDGDFSFSLIVDREDELGELLTAHNELGRALRQQRSELAERELLLETVTQNSPVALVLVDAHGRVAYANLAGRNLLNEGRSLVGEDFEQVMQRAPQAMRLAAATNEDSLFSATMGDTDEMFHLSHRSFQLQGRSHKLYLIKHMTREVSRQELATWKKVIRVLSHELNNSLAPITSLAHSGADLVGRGDPTELAEVFAAIGERAEHLHRFILGYAAFARLPAPRAERVEWPAFVEEVMHQQPFRIVGPLPAEPAWFDRAQVGQALINLLKNANEAGGPPHAVELEVRESAIGYRIEVRDRGPGMSELIMSQALLPFYSTKRNGTGLGLVLVREIAEAHGGHIRLGNREGGGVCATMTLPLRTGEARRDDLASSAR